MCVLRHNVLLFFRGRIAAFVWCAGLSLFAVASPVFAQTSPGDDPGFWDSILQDFLDWAICVLVDLAWPFVEWFLNSVPTSWAIPAGQIIYWLEIANQWIPLTYAFDLLIAWIVWILLFIVVKMLLKILPWVG